MTTKKVKMKNEIGSIHRKATTYVSAIEEIPFCNSRIFGVIGRTFELPFNIEAFASELHDYVNCDKCRENHIRIVKLLTPRFEKFPLCCTSHSQLRKDKNFDKTLFGDIPNRTADKIIFTYHHIISNLDREDWYVEITNYIDWAVASLGQLPYGEALFYSSFFEYLIDILHRNEILERERREKKKAIVEYLTTYKLGAKKRNTDLRILIATYEKWLKTFPFELSYFGSLKQKFENNLPIITGSPVFNKYLGISKVKLHTKSSLIEVLINTTNKLLTEINGLTQYEKDQIEDPDKLKLELIINSRKLKLKEGYKNSSSDEEHKYRKILKEWFNDEKKFIHEIAPLLKSKKVDKEKQRNIEISAPTIALFCYLVNESGAVGKNENESVLQYCKRICNQFNLKFTDRVRQGFLNSASKKNLEKVKSLILAKIDSTNRELVMKYIDNNQPSKQKMYA